MTGYIIRKLPESSIIKRTCLTKDKKMYDSFYIEANTFRGISKDLKIRPNAARFAKIRHLKTLYVVLTSNDDDVNALFLFTLSLKYGAYNNTSIPILDICRCSGPTYAKRHWKKILSFISGAAVDIDRLSSRQYMSLQEEDSDC